MTTQQDELALSPEERLKAVRAGFDAAAGGKAQQILEQLILGFEDIKNEAAVNKGFDCEFEPPTKIYPNVAGQLTTTVPTPSGDKLVILVTNGGSIEHNASGRYEQIKNPQKSDIAEVIADVADAARKALLIIPATPKSEVSQVFDAAAAPEEEGQAVAQKLIAKLDQMQAQCFRALGHEGFSFTPKVMADGETTMITTSLKAEGAPGEQVITVSSSGVIVIDGARIATHLRPTEDLPRETIDDIHINAAIKLIERRAMEQRQMPRPDGHGEPIRPRPPSRLIG